MSEEETDRVPEIDGTGMPIEDRMSQVEQGFNTVHQSQKAIVDSIIEVGDDLIGFKSIWKKIKGVFISDKEGEPKFKDIFNTYTMSIILVILISLAWTPIIEIIQCGLTGTTPDPNVLFIIIKSVGVPFIMMFYFKIVIEKYNMQNVLEKHQNEMRIIELNKEICSCTNDLRNEKEERLQDNHRWELKYEHLKSDMEIQMTQLKGALQTKNLEIDWITKYGKKP